MSSNRGLSTGNKALLEPVESWKYHDWGCRFPSLEMFDDAELWATGIMAKFDSACVELEIKLATDRSARANCLIIFCFLLIVSRAEEVPVDACLSTINFCASQSMRKREWEREREHSIASKWGIYINGTTPLSTGRANYWQQVSRKLS